MKKAITIISVLCAALMTGCGQIVEEVPPAVSFEMKAEELSAPETNVEDTTEIYPESEEETEAETTAPSTTESTKPNDINAENTPSANDEHEQIAEENKQNNDENSQSHNAPQTAETPAAATTIAPAQPPESAPAPVEPVPTTPAPTKPVSTVTLDECWMVKSVSYHMDFGDTEGFFVLSPEDTQTVKNYLFSSKYELGTCDCMGDYRFQTDTGMDYYYHYDSGKFADFRNERTYTVTESMRLEINAIIDKMNF